MNFWDRFFKKCVEKGIKPNPLAKELGVSSATVTKWKNGTIPNGETLIKLADKLECSIDYLLCRVNSSNVFYSVENSLSTDKTELLSIFDSLTELQQGEIIGRAKQLTELNEKEYQKKESV